MEGEQEPQPKWARLSVANCRCEKSTIQPHTHCPCPSCKGKAVHRNTEIAHCKQYLMLAKIEEGSNQVIGNNDSVQDESNANDSNNSDENSALNQNIYTPNTTAQEAQQQQTLNHTQSLYSNTLSLQQQEISPSTLTGILQDDSNNCQGSMIMNNSNIDTSIDVSMYRHNNHVAAAEPSHDDGDDGDFSVPLNELDQSNNDRENLILSNLMRSLVIGSGMNASIKMTEELLAYVGELLSHAHNMENWPPSYVTATSLLKSRGVYIDPVHHKVCFSVDHPLHHYVVGIDEQCPHCDVTPSVDRYYLPIKDKINRWFLSDDMAEKMLAHWRDRDVWLGKSGVSYPVNEIWHGSRFKELQWFWDTDCRWPLPHICTNCHSYINLNGNQSETIDVTCYHCYKEETIQPKFVHGDPRNIALIGHWDGWSPKSGRGSGSIEISIATMEKLHRSKNDHIYTTTFVPEHALPNKEPNALDPFLEPLITELEELFIDGLEVKYPIDVGNLKAGNCTIRCLLICWTGDYPAQCQIGKFSCRGTYGCRVDKCKGESVNGSKNKYYFNNRHHFANRWDDRNFEQEIDVMREVEFQRSAFAKQRRARETGYTGLSLLTKLNDLYGFDTTKDMVRDVMHLVALNLCKKLFRRYFNCEEFDIDGLQDKLAEFPFTSEMLDGHCPRNVHKFKSWTAEEWKIFAFPVAEVVFADNSFVDDEEYHLIWLTARIVELLFHHRSGLKEKELEDLTAICWRRLILLEENVGKEECVITAHNSIHMTDDIKRFGHCDNTWCFAPERVVKRYKEIPTNNKNIEATIAKQEVKREVLAILQKNKKTTYQIDHVNGLVSSLQGAIDHSDAQHPVFYIGALTLTLDNVHGVDENLKETLRLLGTDDEDVYQSFRSCYLFNQQSVLKIGTFVCLADGVVGKIDEFMFTRVAKFVRLQTYNFTGMTIKGFKVLQPTANSKVVQISVVRRKVIVYNGNNDLLLVDFDRPSFSFNFDAVPPVIE